MSGRGGCLLVAEANVLGQGGIKVVAGAVKAHSDTLAQCATGNAHDAYYFGRSQDKVAGAVAPPRLELSHQDLVRAHAHAIWLLISDLDLKASMIDLLDHDEPDQPVNSSTVRSAATAARTALCGLTLVLFVHWCGRRLSRSTQAKPRSFPTSACRISPGRGRSFCRPGRRCAFRCHQDHPPAALVAVRRPFSLVAACQSYTGRRRRRCRFGRCPDQASGSDELPTCSTSRRARPVSACRERPEVKCGLSPEGERCVSGARRRRGCEV